MLHASNRSLHSSVGGRSSNHSLDVENLHQGLPSKAPTDKSATNAEVLDGIEKNLTVLAGLRNSATAHPTYHNANAAEQLPCCDHVPPEINNRHTPFKSMPLSEKETKALTNFADELEARHKKKSAEGQKSIGYMRSLSSDLKAHMGILQDRNLPAVRHDMSILVSEALADILGKLTKHPDSPTARGNASEVLQMLASHFPDYLKESEFRQFFFHGNNQMRTGDQMVAKMLSHAHTAKKAKDDSNEGKNKMEPREAYVAAALTVLHINKPAYPATRVIAKRWDRHNHVNPYDNNGRYSHVTNLSWQVDTAREYGTAISELHPIPHQMTEASFDGRKLESMDQATRYAYYSDPNAITEFFAHDRTHIEAYNKLTNEEREVLIFAATGVPVDSDRLPEVAAVAQKFAKNVVEGQLAEGRTNIQVTFGEITGNKPAVPQDMLTAKARSNDPAARQQAFVEGGAAVLTTLHQHSALGVAEALKEHVAKGKSVEGITTQTSTVFHADALANEAAVNHPDNLKENGIPKEAIHLKNVKDINLKVDENLTNGPKPDFPPGVTYKYKNQPAHLGVSIEPHSYLDATRTTEVHKMLVELGEKCRTLDVTPDTSWLTATARAFNHGMAHFLDQSPDKDLKEMARILRAADNVNNNAFTFLNGGERFFETHLLNGDERSEQVLDMAYMRTSQKKASTTFHTLMGALDAKLQDPEAKKKLYQFVKDGFDKDGYAKPGNYVGMFMDLAKKGRMPFVWGTDNLTPAEARSGDLKTLQAIYQLSAFEIQMLRLSEPDPGVKRSHTQTKLLEGLKDFLEGRPEDKKFHGAKGPIPGEGIRDGKTPAVAGEGPEFKEDHPDAYRNLRAPRKPVTPWPPEKGVNLSLDQDPFEGQDETASIISKRKFDDFDETKGGPSNEGESSQSKKTKPSGGTGNDSDTIARDVDPSTYTSRSPDTKRTAMEKDEIRKEGEPSTGMQTKQATKATETNTEDAPPAATPKERKNQQLKGFMNKMTRGAFFRNYEPGSGKAGDYKTNQQMQQTLSGLEQNLKDYGGTLHSYRNAATRDKFKELTNQLAQLRNNIGISTSRADVETLQAEVNALIAPALAETAGTASTGVTGAAVTGAAVTSAAVTSAAVTSAAVESGSMTSLLNAIGSADGSKAPINNNGG